MKRIFLFVAFAVSATLLYAQKPCGSDISPKPDSLTGISFGRSGCHFVAPGLDTFLSDFQDPKNLIEWVYQKGYTESRTGYYIDGRYEYSAAFMVEASSTSRVSAWNDSTRSTGIIELSGQRFYQYLPDEIKPDKTGLYNAGYGDADPAYCGGLRRVKIPTETLYSGSGRDKVVRQSNPQ